MANTKEGSAAPARTVYKTSTIEKIAYGMGDVACNVVFAITSSLLVYFYSCSRVSAALVGTICWRQDLRRPGSMMAQITDGQARQIQKLGPLDGHPLCSQCGPSSGRAGA